MLKKVLIICSYFFTVTYLYAQEEINVGIYQNAPKIFMDNSDKPSGFFVDILDAIALKENWKLNYIPCVWSECLVMLENGKIDIMPDVAYTLERKKKFLFTDESIISSWSVLFRHKNVPIESIFDLEDKNIAVLENTIQSTAIKESMKKFNIHPHSYIEVSDYEEGFKLLTDKKVDCVLVNRFYELNHKFADTIIKTNIVLEPSVMKYAFNLSRSDLAKAVDTNIKEFKADKNSIFYEATLKWITPNVPTQIPNWIKWIVLGSIIVILTLSVVVILFQRMVRKQTQELLQNEKLMIIQSKHAAMGEMIALIAHQWRQPLNIISIISSNITASIELEEKIKDNELAEYMKSISKQVEHLSTTIDDFRNFFKPNKKKVKINISYMIDEVKKLLGNSLKNNNIEFITKYNNNYEIETFPNELLQVILNIINNAKDVLIEKQLENPTITLSTFQTNDRYNISICDNGGGIPEDILKKIGTQYFTTKAEKGTGLGLYMSIIIVKQHLNGILEWENKEDGACFIISLNK